jgi:hypothetical protein
MYFTESYGSPDDPSKTGGYLLSSSTKPSGNHEKKYQQYEQGDLVIVKPLRERGELNIKTFGFDYDIYVILLKEGDKYKLKSLYNYVQGENKVKKRWYKCYELRKITPQQALEHLESSLVQHYLYNLYKGDIVGIENIKEYLRSLL